MNGWKAAARWLREILYPEGAICAGCGKISDGECLCPACRQELMTRDLLESWEFRDLEGVPAWSMRPHRGLPRDLVLRMKHGAERRTAVELARMLREAPAYFPRFSPDTVVTWVPAPKSRIRERCIDHGQALAEAVARELELPCRRLLERRGKDRPQATLNRAQRQQNLRNAFSARERIECPVLLVDDVLTTGTTALRCIRALRKAGAGEITVLTATRAAGR